MMNQEIKRRIDNARQVLVGKVPDPKSQVEQITTALIYKFMDDMDKESERLGGNPGFFVKDYEKYSWTKLMDSRLGGQERLNLYSEAIMNLSQNPHLPQLFRDIFKDAFLPYRDSETLNLFLKEIDNFSYGSTDNLGDAYEYLLSVLGSQGDAGQFRTPRHIIKFIVSIVDPKKNETILDPACGTAGFLILAYLHILKANTATKPGDMLTPDEKDKLIHNFVGYDIDPGMVRLSLVNMYLHNFPYPHIYEYDTLTSDEKWQEQFDVIMANPPFMSPKGGIRPHKRFAIQANRSEVLFVDYIAEHLNINGRAGVIVPEGIIFKSANAYKKLRKMLIDDYLWAVVSLPAGVFNPYAGVKTSILLFDNSLAKKTKELLFLKIQNDGYDLGAQRREIDKNDLPLALEIIKKYKADLKESKKFELSEEEKQIAHLVAKDKIAKSGDYNLSCDRYKAVLNQANVKWPVVKLSDVVLDMKDGGTPSRKKSEYFSGDIYWCVVKDIKPEIFDTAEKITKLGLENSSAKVWPAGSIIISLGASIGHVGIAKVPTATKQGLSGIVVDKSKILPEFLARILASKKEYIQSLAIGVTIKEVRPSKLKELFIFPLPPLEVQKEIVEQIEVKQKAIEAAKEVIKNLERERRYFGQSLRKIEGVEWVELGEVCELNPKKSEVRGKDIKVSFVPMANMRERNPYFEPQENRELSEVRNSYTYFADGDVLLAKITPCFENGKSGIARNLTNGIGFGSTEFIVLRPRKKVLSELIYYVIASDDFIENGKNQMSGSAGQRRLVIDYVKNYKIPLPSLETQKQLVTEMEEQEKIIEANKKLVGIMEQKIAEVLREI